jgi:hypothetical protein
MYLQRVVYLISERFIKGEDILISCHRFENTVGEGYVWQGKWRMFWSSTDMPPDWDMADYILLKDFNEYYWVFNRISTPDGWILIDKENRLVSLDILKVIFVEVLGRAVMLVYLPIFKEEVISRLGLCWRVSYSPLALTYCLLSDLSKLEGHFKLSPYPDSKVFSKRIRYLKERYEKDSLSY